MGRQHWGLGGVIHSAMRGGERDSGESVRSYLLTNDVPCVPVQLWGWKTGAGGSAGHNGKQPLNQGILAACLDQNKRQKCARQLACGLLHQPREANLNFLSFLTMFDKTAALEPSKRSQLLPYYTSYFTTVPVASVTQHQPTAESS